MIWETLLPPPPPPPPPQLLAQPLLPGKVVNEFSSLTVSTPSVVKLFSSLIVVMIIIIGISEVVNEFSAEIVNRG